MASIYERNFKNLVALIGPVDTWPTAADGPALWRFQDPAAVFMRLSVEFNIIPRYRVRLDEQSDRIVYLSMAHYFTQNGDTMADPEMELRIDKALGVVEAMTFRQDGGFAVNTVVWPEPGKFRPRAQKDTNAFLRDWLKNMKAQRHRRLPSN